MNAAPRPPHSAADGAFRLLIAAALGIDAALHLQLARVYQLAAPAGIGEGNLFRIEAAVAILAGLLVLGYGTRAAYGLAFLVAASAAAAAVLYRYVDVPALGPIPAMYEPVWFGKKVAVTAAEAFGALSAAAAWTAAGAHAARRRRVMRIARGEADRTWWARAPR